MNKKLLTIFLLFLVFFAIYAFAIKRENTNDFVTVKYQGQLGNKLFQTAAAFAYAKDNNLKLILPQQALNSKGLRNVLSRLKFGNVQTKKIIKERKPYVYNALSSSHNCQLEGFFISYKYFDKYRLEIKKLFSPSKRIKFALQRKHPKVFTQKCTVALHIRTFLKDMKGTGKSLYETYPPPDLVYIKKAMSYFPTNALFVVCSDDINWAKNFLNKIERDFYFVENQKSYEDLYLMSFCNHMITSNSTFSFWAAYLNTNKNKKIITRSPWVNKFESKIEDIVPKEWIIIERE